MFMRKLALFCAAVVVAGGAGAWADAIDTVNYNCSQVQTGCGPNTPNQWSGTYKRTRKLGDYWYYECMGQHCVQPSADGSLYYATLSTTPGDYSSGGKSPNVKQPENQCGSIISVDHKSFSEVVPVAGANFQLYYHSRWTKGYKAARTIKSIITRTPKSNVTGIDIVVYNDNPTATSVDSQSYSNTANQTYYYVWGGLDYSSNDVWASVKYRTELTEHHTTYDIPVSTTINIGNLKAKKLGLGGWLPSVWAFYDSEADMMYYGDGRTRSIDVAYDSGLNSGAGGWRIAEEDASVVYEFDALGRIARVRTGITGYSLFEFAYTSSTLSGKLSSITEPFSKVTTFTYDGSGNIDYITAPNGAVTQVSVDGNGWLAAITNPLSKTYSMVYTGTDGLMYTFTKPTSEVSTFTYDSDGYLTKDAHSGGYYTDIADTSPNDVDFRVTSTSRMGRVTKAEYNHSSTEIKTTYPDTATYARTFTSSSDTETKFYATTTKNFGNHARFGSQSKQLTSSSVSDGPTISKTYSDSVTLGTPGNPFTMTSWTHNDNLGTSTYQTVYTGSTKTFVTTSDVGRTNKRVIDNYERTTQEQRGTLTAVDYTYTNDKLTKIAQGARETDLTYNSTSGLLETVTNPLNQTTTYGYDSAERLTSVTLPDSRVIAYGYDDTGRLTSVTPDSRPAHGFTFNTSELLSTYAPPTLSGVPTVNTTYSYNNDKQLTGISRPDGTSVGFTYNSTSGVLATMTSPVGTHTYTFTAYNRTLSAIASPGFNMQFSFNGHVVSYEALYNSIWTGISTFSRTLSSTRGYVTGDSVAGSGATTLSVTYGYDDDHLLTTAGDETLAYNTPNGLLTGVTHGSYTDTDAYNSFGELTDYEALYSSTSIYHEALTRDDLGRITQKTQTITGVGTDVYDYTYDSTGRLSQVDKNSSTVATYTYDDNNNRTGGTIAGVTTSGTYDNQDRMTDFNVFDYTYNANGDLLTKTNTVTSEVWSYSYDVFGNLRSVTLPNADVITYEIDGKHRRVGRKLNGTLTNRYIYTPEGKLIGEANVSTGVISRRYVYGSKPNIPDYFIEGSNKFRIISDHLGSPRLIIKVSDGSIQQKMDHDEFGRVILDTNPGYTPFGFAGGVYDASTGLVRFGARDYDSYTGRWTNKDPILFKGGDENLYGYVMMDPINSIDPEGLMTCKQAGWAIDGAVRGGVIVGCIIVTKRACTTIAGVAGSAARMGYRLVCQDPPEPPTPPDQPPHAPPCDPTRQSCKPPQNDPWQEPPGNQCGKL